jgi:hypothetical protein
MIDQTRVFDALEPGSHELNVKASKLVKPFSRVIYFLVACLFVMSGGISAQGPQKKYAQEYRQVFKGPPANPKDVAFVGPDAKAYVKFEPEGLRITLPPGHPKERTGTGVSTGFAVRGDFEITLSFEVLMEPTPEDAGPKTRLTLATNLDKPSPWLNQVALTRRITLRGGVQNVTWMTLQDENSKKSTPTSAAFFALENRGRFRLVREGDEVSYYVAEGADGAWKFLTKYTYSAEDVRDVAIVASTGGEKASFDVRVTELVILAAAFPETPPVRKAIAVADAKPPDVLADPPQPGPEQRYGGYLIAALLVGLTITLAAVLALGFVLRKRRSIASPATTSAARTSLSFPCPKCAKGLKTTREMAGKKVKCPTCGTVALAPSSEADQRKDSNVV